MSFPPLQSTRDSTPTSEPKASISGSARPRQSAWGLPAPHPRSLRDLAPLSTNVTSISDAGARRADHSASPSAGNAVGSPFAAPFSSVGNSLNRLNSRNTSSISSSSPFFPPFQTGSQQLSAGQLLSPRLQANTTFPNPNSASSAAASTTASQGGGGGSGSGGGLSRAVGFSPSVSAYGVTSPTASTFDRNPFGSVNTPRGGSSESSVSKIVVTQVFLLLGSITEKEGKAKWESQADAIRKLVDSHGMDVFAKYFRRLLVGNSPQIFPGISRNVENPGNYQLLAEEVEKASQSSEQARKIAEIIDTSEGDIFKDFDLNSFLAHFRLDPVGKCILASAFTQVSRPDLRIKASRVLSSTFPLLLQSFENANSSEQDFTPKTLATAAFRILRDLPDSSRDGTEKTQINVALTSRYSRRNQSLPQVIRSAMALADLFDSSSGLAYELMKQGSSTTASIDSAKDFLRRYGRVNLNDEQLSIAIMFMVLTPDADQYQLSNFVGAIRESFSSIISWTDVVRNFDRDYFIVDQGQFLSIYRALVPIAREDENFDIQMLWSAKGQNIASQLSFATTFASLAPSQLDATTIPRLRVAFDPNEAMHGPEEIQPISVEARRDPMISLEAVRTIVEAIWSGTPSSQLSQQDIMTARALINQKMTFFACSASGIPKPWSPTHSQFLTRTITECLARNQENYSFILHILWKQDKNFVYQHLVQTHSDDPLKLPQLLEHIEEHGWLKELCIMMTGFGIDLAALAHRKELLDLHEWAQDKLQRGAIEFTNALTKFLIIKTQDELRTSRMEQLAPRTVSLAMKTVHAMLEILEEHLKDRRDELNQLERQCMQAFPRLCNYGEGFDDVIEANGAESNTLPTGPDGAMQDYYKRMYSRELEVREVIEGLRDCKTSNDPEKQDLFACMIHGLFDEFVCFNEYPIGPLQTTAVLFGGIINYRLVNNIALNVAREMVLESVQDYTPDLPMYKFGLQALQPFLGRLPEWPDFCQRLVQVSGLQGTEAYTRAQDVLHDNGTNGDLEADGMDDILDSQTLPNGTTDDLIENDSLVTQFRSIDVDPLTEPKRYEEPEEDIQDKVLFVLNNVSSENLATKINDLAEVLEPRYFQWFSSYIVEQRAKSQPNYQQLYLDLLGLLDERSLWTDILRETYVSVRKVMNAESTMKSAVERTYLKNLATWLGLLTIARDKPIKHKNVAFKELLLEGWESQRLLLAIPFTCEVLLQGVKSVVFKPPNPWIMEIVGLLLELYDLPDLKIQQKFAIEILLGAFGLPRKGEGMERGSDLKRRQQYFDTQMAESILHDGIEAFDDIGINSLGKGLRNSRFTPPALPDLESLLVLPPHSSSPMSQSHLRRVVQNAVRKSIEDIIGPVVERSITIATISTKDLIQKDFAQEPDENRIREAFEQMVKSLAGSLASVTCKEPLRMSMTSYIRATASDIPDQPLAEGSILMCVNDNLEMACKIVEKQAEDRAMMEIEPAVEAEVNKRRQHKIEYPNEPYRDPNSSHWATYIPEPYKQIAGGLNHEQMEIYQHFSPQARVPSNHLQNASTDSGKQIPDVLQEAGFPNIPNLSTPAEPPALPHQAQQPQSQGRLLPPSMNSTRPPSQVNGYMDGPTIWDHVQETLTDLVREARENSGKRLRDFNKQDPIPEGIQKIISLVRSVPQEAEQIAYRAADTACSAIYSISGLVVLEAEVLVQVVKLTCTYCESYSSNLIWMLRNQAEEKILNVPATAALLQARILDFASVDTIFAHALYQRNTNALQCLSTIFDLLLLDKIPSAMRANFSRSLGALGDWAVSGDDNETVQALVAKLKQEDSSDMLSVSIAEKSATKKLQMEYIFEEWLSCYAHSEGVETTLLALVNQLWKQLEFSSSSEEFLRFYRFAIEASVEAFNDGNALMNGESKTFLEVDAMAKMTVLIVKTRDERESVGRKSKASYMKSLLYVVVLLLNADQVKRGDRFNQKPYYRFFSMVLFGWHENIRGDGKQDPEMILAFGETLLLLEPSTFPAFIFSWLTLLSHQAFLPAILKTAGHEGSDLYARLMESMLGFVSQLLKPAVLGSVSKELYRGVLRILLILHHDFPEFLADNHFRLCNIIPPHCTQLRNLVLSAFPSSILELPDPFSDGLKVDRLEDIKRSPTVDGNIPDQLRKANVKDLIDGMLQSKNLTDEGIERVVDILHSSSEPRPDPINPMVLHAIVIYIGQMAVTSVSSSLGAGSSFSTDGPHAVLLSKLAKILPAASRYHLLGAMVNQLRYPNNHTWFFSSTTLHLFEPNQLAPQDLEIRQQITRILLERLIVHRPHPWGLIIVLLELMKNRVYMFWEQPFVKTTPEVQKLFDVLFSHVNRGEARGDGDLNDYRLRV